MAEQVYGNVTIKGFVIGPVVVNDYVLGVIKNADNDYALQIKRGGEEQMIPVVSPMLTTEAIEGGTRVTIEDISGTRSFDILNGKDGIDGKDGANGIDGQDGKDGKDGVSPVVAVTEIENGHRVTITDAEGEKTFDVPNGGSGLPEGGAPYQQLVTDGTGKTVWEDRLAYKGIVESVVLPEQTAKIENYQYFGYCQIGGFEPELYANEDGTEKDIKVGRTYIFTIDGVEYRCAAKYGVNNVSSGSKSVYIGNADVKGYGDQYDEDYEDTGEPFLFVPTYDGVYTLIMREEDEGEHTISLRAVDEEVHPISPEYLAAEHGANKVLVTDGEGKTVWEDRLAYSNTTTPLNIPTIDPNVGFEGQQFADVWTVKQTNMSSFEMTAYIGDVMADEFALRGPEDLVGSTLQFYKNGNIEEVRIEKDHLIDDGVKFKDGLMLFEIDANSTVKFGVEIEMYGERRPTIFLVDVYRNDIKPIDAKYLPEGVGVLPVFAVDVDVETMKASHTAVEIENAIKNGYKAVLRIRDMMTEEWRYGELMMSRESGVSSFFMLGLGDASNLECNLVKVDANAEVTVDMIFIPYETLA